MSYSNRNNIDVFSNVVHRVMMSTTAKSVSPDRSADNLSTVIGIVGCFLWFCVVGIIIIMFTHLFLI